MSEKKVTQDCSEESNEISNIQLKAHIDRHISKRPACLKIFKSILPIFKCVDIVLEAREIEDSLLNEFVFGMLIVAPLAMNDSKYKEEANRLTRPVLGVIKEYSRSDDFLKPIADKSLSSLSFLTENELSSPIQAREVLEYTRCIAKFPLTSEEMDNIVLIYEQERRFKV